MMMQLVMIKPTKTESFSEMSGWNAFRTWSTMITKEATTTSGHSCIRSGIMPKQGDDDVATDHHEHTDKLMMTACCNCTVMASAEQMPNTCTVMGLESSNGSIGASGSSLKITTFHVAAAVSVPSRAQVWDSK